jgi:hypothetical protein
MRSGEFFLPTSLMPSDSRETLRLSALAASLDALRLAHRSEHPHFGQVLIFRAHARLLNF